MATPMRSFPADRLRPKWADLLVLAVLLAAAGALALALRPQEGGRKTAVVTLDGVQVASQDLTGLSAPILLEVAQAPYPITIEFDAGRVRVAHTECPGGDCEHTGWVSRTGGQIICLPNRLAVTITGGASDGIDAVSG